MKTKMSCCFVTSAVVLGILVTGCGKKDGAQSAAGPGQSAQPQIADVQAWTLANEFLKDQENAKAKYGGKTCIVRNLLAYQCVGDAHKVSGCAYDPKTKTASISIASRYQGQDLVKGDEFDFEVEIADPSEFDSIKDSAETTVDGKSFAAFVTLFSVQGTIHHDGSDNSLIVKKAKLVK